MKVKLQVSQTRVYEGSVDIPDDVPQDTVEFYEAIQDALEAVDINAWELIDGSNEYEVEQDA